MGSRVGGNGGCEAIADTVQRTGKMYFGFMVNADAVVSEMNGTDGSKAAIDFLSTIGLSGLTLKQGVYISVPVGQKITSITLASGSVIAYS